MKFRLVFILLVGMFSCTNNSQVNIEIPISNDVSAIESEIKKDSVIRYDSLYHNYLVSESIKGTVLNPGFISLKMVELEIGEGEKSISTMSLINGGACYPITSIYQNFGLEFFYMRYENELLSRIEVLNSKTVKLKTGIEIGKSSKKDVLLIYGNNFEEHSDRYETVINYHYLGISFVLKKDTVRSYKVYRPFIPEVISEQIKISNYREYTGKSISKHY